MYTLHFSEKYILCSVLNHSRFTHPSPSILPSFRPPSLHPPSVIPIPPLTKKVSEVKWVSDRTDPSYRCHRNQTKPDFSLLFSACQCPMRRRRWRPQTGSSAACSLPRPPAAAVTVALPKGNRPERLDGRWSERDASRTACFIASQVDGGYVQNRIAIRGLGKPC